MRLVHGATVVTPSPSPLGHRCAVGTGTPAGRDGDVEMAVAKAESEGALDRARTWAWSRWQSAKGAVVKVMMQEITAERLTASIAVGLTIGICPLVGLTFVIVGVVGVLFRSLNMAAMQLVNAITTPIEMALLVPYLRLGEYMIGTTVPLALTPEMVRESISVSLIGTMTEFGFGFLIAALAWLVTVPLVGGVLYVALLPIVRYLLAQQQNRHK